MNQVLKRRVYGMGNKHHVEYIIQLTGMDEAEATMFRYLHEKRDDHYIMDMMGLDKNSFPLIEDSVSRKFMYGVLMCIDRCIDED